MGNLNKKSGILSFIQEDNLEMIIGVIGGAIFVLLLLQQSKYYKNLSEKKLGEKRDCGECGSPSGDGDEGGKKKKKCENPDYDEKSTRLGKAKSFIGKKVRKAFNAEKSGSAIKEENTKLEMKKERNKLNST